MSAGDPDPQIPPMPDRLPDEVPQDRGAPGGEQAGDQPVEPEAIPADPVAAPEPVDESGTPDAPVDGTEGTPAPEPAEAPAPGETTAAGDHNAPVAGDHSAPTAPRDAPQWAPLGPDAQQHSAQYGYGAAAGMPPAPGSDAGAHGASPYGGPAQGSTPPPGGSYGAAPYSTGPTGSGPAGTGPAGTGPIPQPAPAPGYAPGTAPVQPESKKKRKSKLPLILSLSAVGVVLVLVLVGALVIVNLNKTKYGPETVAHEYFDAVVAGDLDAAQGVAKATVPNGANEALLTPEVFAASSTSVEDVQISDAKVDGDTATMTATYSLEGQQHELPLTAVKDGKQGLFFDQWALQGPVLQTLKIDVTQVDGATVNGAPVDLAQGETEYAVMPGTYEVEVPETTYTNSGNAAITVGYSPEPQPQPADLAIPISVNDKYKKDVVAAVEKKLDECLESGKLETDCGFFARDGFQTDEDKKIYDTLKTDGITFEMTEKPEIVVTDYGAPSTGSFYTDSEKPGKVKAVAKTKGGDRYELTTDLRPAGTATVEDDKITIDYFTNS